MNAVYPDANEAEKQSSKECFGELSSRHIDGLAIKSLEDVDNSCLDPRVNVEPRPSADRLDERMGRQVIDALTFKGEEETVTGEDEPLYIEFEHGDPRNPVNFSHKRKWAITIWSSYATLLAAVTASSYSIGWASMCRDLNCSHFQATIGISMYTLGFGVVPLITASFSEEFGRQPLYWVSAGGFLLMYILIALAPNIQAVLVGRFLQGAFGSTWATMVGGTIADIWTPEQRGLPMSIFAFTAVSGTGFGSLIAGWIEMNEALEWKWIEWIFMMLTGLYIVVLPFIMKETRSSILLRRLAQKMRKETGNNRYRARVEDEQLKLRTLIWISCTRPIHLLISEPIVFSFSLWISFAWGVMFALILSIPLTFQNLYHFNIGQLGTAFVVMIVGSCFGFLSNIFQERIYQINFPTRGTEARLYGACAAAVLLPVGIFIYAWTSFSSVHWIAPAIGIVLLMWAVYVIYLAVFTYLADSYGPFASSALAGQSLCRNLAAMSFPLFTTQMYDRLGYNWASTLFGCLACAMIPIPFVLFFYGPRIRAHSRFSRQVLAGNTAPFKSDDAKRG